MRHRRTAASACAAFGVLLPAVLLSGSTGAAAQSSGYTFTRTPGHGPRGTVVSVEGTGCAYQGKPYETARVSLYFRGDPDLARPRVERTYDVAADGTFAGDLRVPSDAPYGAYRMLAECYASDMAFPVGDTGFTVDAPAPTRTPSPSVSPTPRTTPSPRTPSPTPSATRSASPPASPTARPTPSPAISRPVATATPSASASSAPKPVAVPPVDDPAGRAPAVALAAALLAANAVGAASLRRR